jgi:hypothetical protein
MHLTPNQRIQVVNIYFNLVRRSLNRAKVTSQLAGERRIFISERGVKKSLLDGNLEVICLNILRFKHCFV